MWGFFVVLIIQFAGSRGLKAEWIQLSDSASLPMSKNYRDNLRERIGRLNVDALNSTERAAILKIKRMLGDDGDAYLDEASVSIPAVFILGMVAVGVWLVYTYIRKLRRHARQASPEDLRRARDMKYQ